MKFKSRILLFLVILFIGSLWLSSQSLRKSKEKEVETLTYSQFQSMLQRSRNKIGKIYSGSSTSGGTKAKQGVALLELSNPENDLVLKITSNQISGRYLRAGNKIEASDDRERVLERTIPFVVESFPGLISDKLLRQLDANGIAYEFVNEETGFFSSVLFNILPILLIIFLLWILMVRQIQHASNRVPAFGKSKARLNDPEKSKKITFNDVAGCKEAKQELTEVVDFLKDPNKFQTIGAKIPRGVLLVGQPGTGKTLLARAVAGEAGAPFYSISGSDFMEMFVGVGASRVRDLFAQAKKSSPCIVFIDEIDAVGRLRGAGLGGGHDEREQTLNQMLVEMDGFDENEGIIIIAATNRPDVLDPALLRPGRFDRQVIVDVPDLRGRVDILKIYIKKILTTPEVSLEKIARGTPGFTGADLANLVNEAALLAARHDKNRVAMEDMEEAKDKVMMGPERRSFLITPKEKEFIAYHEGGHALLGLLLPYAEPIHKVTIIPRGQALGLTQSLPEEERHIQPKKYWEDRICVLMGGYLAENMIFGDTSTGASNDIQVATKIARRMVCEWGMSSKVGTVSYTSENQNVFLGREMSHARYYSDDTAFLIDQEIKSIIRSQLERGRKLLAKHRPKLEKIAKALLAQESVSGEELDIILGRSTAKEVAESKEKSVEDDVNPASEPIPAPAH